MQISVFLVVITVLIIFFAEKIGFQCNNSLITATNNTRFVFFTTKKQPISRAIRTSFCSMINLQKT